MTKPQKAAAKRFKVALHRLRAVLNDSCLVESLTMDFPMDEFQFGWWENRAKAAAATKLGNPGRPGAAQREAVEQAARLLKAHGLPLTATRKGQLCRLAVLFYGEPGASLYHHCCEFLKEGRNRVEKSTNSGL
jgi:hypothetical protein